LVFNDKNQSVFNYVVKEFTKEDKEVIQQEATKIYKTWLIYGCR